MANRSVVNALSEARRSLWFDDRRWTALDALSKVVGRPHTEHEYLTARLELAHAHMVDRDLAEQAVLAVLDAPRPSEQDAEEARGLLGDVLHQYVSHRGALEDIVRTELERQEEAARRARRAATPPTRIQPTTATVNTARLPGRSLA